MTTFEFIDLDRQKVTLQHSSLATKQAFRIYVTVKGDDGVETDECIHLSKNHASIVICALQELIEESE